MPYCVVWQRPGLTRPRRRQSELERERANQFHFYFYLFFFAGPLFDGHCFYGHFISFHPEIELAKCVCQSFGRAAALCAHD